MEPTAESLARTYTDRVYPDPWQKVLDYERVQAYAAEHPDEGRTRVGTALDLPPERVRGWLDGGIPDPVRGIRVATDHGWLDPDPAGDTASALIDLLAHVLAGGSILDARYVVRLTPGSRVGVDELRAALDRVGVESRIDHERAAGRATEVVAARDGSVLGRCLVAMGAAAGSKIDLQHVPEVVRHATPTRRASFCRIYAAHRAVEFDGKATRRIVEERPCSYMSELRDLFEDVTGETVGMGEDGLTITADAARRLPPSPASGSPPAPTTTRR